MRVATEEFNRRYPGVYNASLIIDGADPETLTSPEMVSELLALQNRLSEISFVGQVTSYANLVAAGPESVPKTDDEIVSSLDSVFDSPQDIYAGGLISEGYQRANV